MRTNRLFALGATLLVALAACSSSGSSSAPATTAASSAPTTAASVAPSTAPSVAPSEAAKADIRIGSDNFYESKLMAELYAQALEAAGYKVTRSFGLGSRQDRAPAFEQGQVDLVPEYVGSGLGYYQKALITGDGDTNRTSLQAVYDAKGRLATVLAITPAQDTNAAVVRKDTADSMKLAKMSDLAAVQDQLRWGLPPDCDANPLCKGALEAYGIKYPPKQREALAACDAPIAEALKGNAIDFAWLCSTQPAIAQNGFVTLEDDLATQPAENIAPVVRNDYLAKVDPTAFAAILDAVSAKMTTDELTKLGVKVGVDNEDIGDVAKQWLTDQGLLSS
jgi:osmoprotectant transport system substrate-binding protein